MHSVLFLHPAYRSYVMTGLVLSSKGIAEDIISNRHTEQQVSELLHRVNDNPNAD
jgi:hypothetical protein